QRSERVLDDVPALHAQQRGDPSAVKRIANFARGPAQLQLAGIAGDHAAREVDLLELHPCEPGADLGGGVHAPELSAHAPASQARPIGVARRASTYVV